MDEISTKLRKCNEKTRDYYWERIKILRDELSYKDHLWDIAPVEEKNKVIEERKKGIKQKYCTFFNCVDRFNKSNYPFEKSLSESWQSLYDFDELDCNLIENWCADAINTDYYESKKVQMKSARGAEKLVLKFYRDMEYSVEDTSIHQITGESETWKTGDIRIKDENNDLLCDVKNARKAVNSSAYSEFCVPSFKKNRGNDVLITAVLSPYLRQEFINGTREPKFPVENPIVLGEFESKKLFDLEAYFNDEMFCIGLFGGNVKSSYFPPWLFDYNERFYEKQNEVIFDFLKLEDSGIPDWEELEFLNNDNDVKVLPLFIASKRKIPDKWISYIPSWQIDFINLLIDMPTLKITLPYLFISLLKHFLLMLSCEDETYSPRQYIDLMYMNHTKDRSGHREFSEPPPSLPYSTAQQPLKLYDPLDIINALCKTLEILWDSREAISLSSFKIFYFNGKGLLKGKRDKDDQPKTILAYCGGQVEQRGNGKCGYKPLIIGKHKNCKSCGRLICPNKNCQYCSKDCKEYQRRKQKIKIG
ncbi:hypothetical protein IQ249_10890 [Lusitaniella coriacea LEGE 07157]|uniref:Uncharacterized protein n=1 Tax=Lusitaniella coriacea LEGE 07157 TaxID=945747 RepID=A0A8J7DWX9_9CYAN|nr:hypothetical protein [Lusitaniella coriacea]MBE9116405.1 hypothetical protein [Lusitaniella coriacea LEGE 07157]